MKFLLLSIWLILASNTSAQTLPHTFTANSAAKAEEVNENFQFLANQFKVNKKTIDCSTDNMTKAIEDGYNHLVLNGTCSENLLITPFVSPTVILGLPYSSMGFEGNKPVTSLTLEGGTQGVWDNTNNGFQRSFVFGGLLNIINLTVSQSLVLHNGGRLLVDNSSLENITSAYGSSAEIANSTVTCTNSNTCIYVSNNGNIRLDNVTLTNSGDDYTINSNRTSSVEIKNSAINNTNTSSDSKPTIGVNYNSSMRLEDTDVTSSNNEIFIGFDGFLELKRGSIKRTTGSPTIKISGPGVLYEYDGTIADITCDGKLAYVDKSSSSTVITNNNNAECQ